MGNDAPFDFWAEFGKSELFVEVSCTYTDSLAKKVLDTYDIDCISSLGGGLDDIDIKHMDAIQVLKMSLLEQSAADGVIYEPVVTPEGSVDFKEVGRTGTGFESHIYYELQTGSYKEECSGVMITGKKPLATRRPVEFHPIWEGGDHEIYDTGYMFSSCAKPGFNQYASIVYDDPHLNSAYNDGIDNLYEITNDNPYDTIIGYAHYLTWPDWDKDKDAVINRTDSTKILIKLPSNLLGTLYKRPNASSDFSDDPSCYKGMVGEEIAFDDGVPVPLPAHFRYESVRGTEVDKFSGISGVYILGRELTDLRGVPRTPSDAYGDGFDVSVTMNKNYNEIFTLELGTHYQVAYDANYNPAIVFADNSRVTDPIEFADGGVVDYTIHPDSEYAIDLNGTQVENGTGVILATGLTKGILVQEIYVAIDLDTPSINIFHPNGVENKAREIAESLEYLVAPLVVVDEPAPIGFNGRLIDQVASKVDHDPTTAQDFEDTPLELAFDEMDAGGGMTLTLSFLDEDGVAKLSGALQSYMNSGDGVETTYVCGPDADPEIGEATSGGIINSIVYSYQDSSSYTISVNAGPKLVGGLLAQVDGGPAMKATESVSAKATIRQDLGNHIHYKVSIDGFGDRVAINMTPAVLRSGDIVNVSVYNNPVEA